MMKFVTKTVKGRKVKFTSVNMQINNSNEIREYIPAFTKYSIPRNNLKKTMKKVDATKILPTVFAFTDPKIFREEDLELMDFNGNIIPKKYDDKVLVYLDKSDNLNLMEIMTEPIPAVIVECKNVADAYQRVSTSMSISQIPQKDQWMGLTVATTCDEVLSQVMEFVNTHKVNGTTAQYYFGLRCTVSELKKASITKISPLGDKVRHRSIEEAENLFKAASEGLLAKTAIQSRIALALHKSLKKYPLDKVIEALYDIDDSARTKIKDAPCEHRGEELIFYIAEWMGSRNIKAA